MEQIGPDGQNDLFLRSNETREGKAPIFLNFHELRCHFFQKFTWMSIKTLVIEPVATDSQNSLFSRSTEPRSSLPSFLVFRNSDVIFEKVTRPSIKTLAMNPINPHGQNGPFSNLRIFTLAMDLFGDDDTKDPISRSNEPRSR
ncbi:hypothetical protein H5410_031942 [Solanum commersonii]|uniref:Uncharacterized protein n=1 Tax=Solanum commersonii TaxID=4109 RepID=A0A9J5YN69_SOLCO|nr:hypothetical protein H5410_031942 [Solanum commersonii]